MKKTLITICSIFLLSQLCIAQIGINTENAKTLVHIDGASTPATTNPLTGTVTAAQAADDVVITSQGNVGIGTIAPSTRLDIISPTPGGAIRIVDSTQGVGKMLVCDANGVGTWGSVIGSWFAILDATYASVYQTTNTLRKITGFTTGILSNALAGSVNTTTGTIQVPYTGRYRVTITGHWGTNRVGSNPYLIAPYLAVNGGYVWNGSMVGYSNGWGLNPTFVAILNFTAGDNITLFTDERNATNANMVDRCSLILEFIQ